MQDFNSMAKRNLVKYALELGLNVNTKADRAKLVQQIQEHITQQNFKEDTEMSEAEVKATESEEVVYTLDDGTPCSRSAAIRQEFNKGKSRKDLAIEFNVKYYVVYAATANMFNAAHPEDAAGTGRGSISVPKVNEEFKYVDAEGNVVETAEEAVSVPRADLMKELAKAGVTRSALKEYFNVAYATVYAATKDAVEGTGTRTRKVVIDPETGEEVKRSDYIRKLYAQGLDRREIAKQVTNLTGELTDYATVWAATKPKKEVEESEAEETEESAE